MSVFDIDDTGQRFFAGRAYNFVARVRMRSYHDLEARGSDIRAMGAGVVAQTRHVSQQFDLVGAGVEASEGLRADTCQCRVNFVPNQDIGILALSTLMLAGFDAAGRRAGVIETDLPRPDYVISDALNAVSALLAAQFTSRQVVVASSIATGFTSSPPPGGNGVVGSLGAVGNNTVSTDPNRNGNTDIFNRLAPSSPWIVPVVVVGGALVALAVVGYAAGNFARLAGR